MIIDVHTHAFPDHLAARAMAQLQAETDQVTAVLDGTVADLLRSMDRFPTLRVIAAHCGAWADWDEVERHLLGQDVYFDISCSFDFMSPDQAARILRGHRADRLLFGSDSPWVDQARTLEQLRAFDLGAEAEEQLLGRNAGALLRRLPPRST